LYKDWCFLQCFFALWYGLAQVQWTNVLHVKEQTTKRQKQLSKLILEMQRGERNEYTDDSLRIYMADIKNKICRSNNIDTATIQVYVFGDGQVNAFAIPGGNIVVYSALIRFCDNPDMLAGVMAHEIAHIQCNHISKKLAKEIGISTVFAIFGDNLKILGGILRNLTSNHFNREQEAEADAIAVTYLQKAQIDPAQAAALFTKLNDKMGSMSGAMEWLSTHPDSKKRAEKIKAAANKNIDYQPVLDTNAWAYLKNQVK
jgi:predicted Zn-dependent protease